MPSFLPFSFTKKNTVSLKGITGADYLHTDEQGRHLIFRHINGRVTPIRVGAEEFAEWLVGQGVNINPADQKSLRELDKELEIMERAAEVGGPALQKQYENYFNERRKQYADMALRYYQQALQNQASLLGTTPQNIATQKQQMYQTASEGQESQINRVDLPRRGWVSAFSQWVHAEDEKNGFNPAKDGWYYNRIYGAMLSHLSRLAERGLSLNEVNFEDVFSFDFIKESLQNHYGDFFGNQGGDPKKVIAAVKTIVTHYKNNNLNQRSNMENFVSYWYGKMQNDYERVSQETLESPPTTTSMKDIPENLIPKELPTTVTSKEGSALLGMYRQAKGSKLNAAHRVIIHGLSRLVESVPLRERVNLAVEISNGKTGINAVHKEGYKRAFTEYTSLGLIPDRDELIQDAVSIAIRSASGSTQQKISAIKRISMIMGTIDGAAVLSSNPGIQESQFTRKWNDTAINAGRVRAEGPGLIDIIMDDESRNAHTFTNQDLRLLHPGSGEQETSQREEKPTDSSEDKFQYGFSFAGSKLVLESGHVVEMNPTNQGYIELTVSAPDKSYNFQTRVANPPMPLSKMAKDDVNSYLESLSKQVGLEIERYKKSLPSNVSEEVYDIPETGTFRVPLFDFPQNLTVEDRDFLGDLVQHVEEGGLEVNKLVEGAYRITNPHNGKTFDILFSKSKKKLVGMTRDEDNNVVPFTEPSISDFVSSIGYRTS